LDRAKSSSYPYDPEMEEQRAAIISILEQAEASWRAEHPESSSTSSN